MRKIPPHRMALALGALALALILGALGFEYLGGILPCEMCMWQRYPHVAAAVVGIGGGFAVTVGLLDRKLGTPVAILTMLLVAASGAIAVYHAGVEWQFWPGPSECTGNAFVGGGPLNLNAPVVRCDVAAWRLFGISLAGYNAIASLGGAGIAAWLLAFRRSR